MLDILNKSAYIVRVSPTHTLTKSKGTKMDTLMIALLVAAAPVRPTFTHQTHIQAPSEGKPVVVAVASVKEPEMATTCHLNANGTCWSE